MATKNKIPKMDQPNAVDEKKSIAEESKNVTLDEALKKFDMEKAAIFCECAALMYDIK
jgi:hypothetical protein